jgi:4-amino-4-deoxy-L-arabinose transferase-like glycosyltransferase
LSPDEPAAKERPGRAELALLLAGAALLLVGLASFGLWDPYEIRVADAARALADGARPFSLEPQLGRPPALVLLVASGFKLLGIGELGGRLPVALTAFLALVAAVYAGWPLVGRRAALWGAFALGTSPAFLIGGRQLTSDAPTLLAVSLAVGGLLRALDEGEGAASPAARAGHLLVGLLGLLLGLVSVGMLVGVTAPLATVAAALALRGRARLTVWITALLAAGTAAEVLWVWSSSQGYSLVLGGTRHALLHNTTMTTLFVRAGFALAPWIALSIPGAALALTAPRDDKPAAGGVALVVWTLALYVASTFQAAAVQDLAAAWKVEAT